MIEIYGQCIYRGSAVSFYDFKIPECGNDLVAVGGDFALAEAEDFQQLDGRARFQAADFVERAVVHDDESRDAALVRQHAAPVAQMLAQLVVRLGQRRGCFKRGGEDGWDISAARRSG